MKKKLVVLCLTLSVLLLTSCAQQIGSEQAAPGLGPVDGAQAPTNPAPAPHVNTADIPEESIAEPTEPTEPDHSNGEDEEAPLDGEMNMDTGAGEDDKAPTTALSGWPSNNVYSAKGDAVDKSASGNTTTYRVKYTRTLTMVVDVTPVGENVKVDVYFEHYRLSMNPEKTITIAIGSHESTALTAEVEWKNNTPARTLLMSATASADGMDSVDISVKMDYNVTYHGEEIESFRFEETVFLK